MDNEDNFCFKLPNSLSVKLNFLTGGVSGMASVPSRPADCSGYRKRYQVWGPGGDRRPEASTARSSGEEWEAHQRAGGDQVPQVCKRQQHVVCLVAGQQIWRSTVSTESLKLINPVAGRVCIAASCQTQTLKAQRSTYRSNTCVFILCV